MFVVGNWVLCCLLVDRHCKLMCGTYSDVVHGKCFNILYSHKCRATLVLRLGLRHCEMSTVHNACCCCWRWGGCDSGRRTRWGKGQLRRWRDGWQVNTLAVVCHTLSRCWFSADALLSSETDRSTITRYTDYRSAPDYHLLLILRRHLGADFLAPSCKNNETAESTL